MRDLEIRAKSSRNRTTWSYGLVDMISIVKLLEESINKKKGIPQKITIDLPVDAYIPNWYISKGSVKSDI